MRPRAWRWNSETPSSCSRADTCRDTADCESPSCSPACVKLPASAAAWKTLSLSQSMLDVACGEHARHRSRRRERRGLDVARGLHIQLPNEQLGGGGVADGDEYAVRLSLGERAGLDVAQDRSLHLERIFLAQHVFQHGVPDHRNLRILEQTILHNLFRAETVAAGHERAATD